MNASTFEPISLDSGTSRARRGHGFHIFLAALGLAMALGVYIGSAAGFLDERASMLIVICLGVMALPLIFMDPVHGILVYAMLAPISLEFEVSGIELRVHDPLALLILIGIVIQSLKSSRRLPKLMGKRVLILYAVGSILLTVLGMVILARGREPNIFHALKVVQYVVIAIATGISVRSSRDLRLVLGGFLAGLILLSAQLGYDADHVTGRTTGAAVGEKANVLSVYLAVACAVVLGCADRVKDKMVMLGLLALLLISGYAMLLTKSRSGYASLGMVLLVGIFVMRRKAIPVGVLSLGAIAFFVKQDLFARAQTLGAVIGIGEDSSFEARKIAFNLIWRQTSGQPITLLFGEGRGAEDLGYADTQWGIELLYGGLIGIGVCLLMVVSTLWFANKTWRKSREYSPTISAAATAGLLAMVAATVSTFGMTSWSSIRLAEAIFILVGVIMATDRLMRIADKRRSSALGQMPTRPNSIGVLPPAIEKKSSDKKSKKRPAFDY